MTNTYIDDDSDSGTPPLVWWCTGAGLLLALLIAAFTSTDQSGNLFRQMLSGLSAMPTYYLAYPGLVIAVGATLSASDTKTSLKYCAIAASIIAGVLALIGMVHNSMTFEFAQQTPSGNALIDKLHANQPKQSTVSTIFLFVMLPLSFALALFPLLVSSAATSILGHLGLNKVLDVPMPWQETSDSSDDWLQDVAAGAGVIGLAVWFLVWPAMKAGFFAYDPLAEQRYVISKLTPAEAPPEGPVLSRQDGATLLEKSVARLEKRFADADNKDCWALDRLDQSLHNYFSAIRYNENWEPGKEYSKYSKRAIIVLEKSLERKYVSWDKMSRYVTIHADKEKYGSTVAVVPDKCLKR